MVKKTREEIGKKISKGLMKDLFGSDESEDEDVGNNNTSPRSNKSLLKQKMKSSNTRETKITVIKPVQEIQILAAVIKPVQEIQILAVNKSSKSPLRQSSSAQNPESESLHSAESSSKKDESKYLSYKLVKSSKRQLTQDLFDSSSSSELDPTPQKLFRRTKKEHAIPSDPRKEEEHATRIVSRKEEEHATRIGPRKEGEYASPSGPKKVVEYANPSGPKKIGKHTSPSGSRKVGDHSNPNGSKKVGEQANQSGPRKVREKDCPGSNGPGKVKELRHSIGLKSENSTIKSVESKKIKVPFNDVPQKFSFFENEKSSSKVNSSGGKDSKKKKSKDVILQPSPQSKSDSEPEAGFSFSNADKETYAKREKKKKNLELKTESIEPKLGSSVFEYIEDEETAKIRKKLEKQALNKEIKARLKQKERKSKSHLHNSDRSSQSEAEESNATPAKRSRKSKTKPREKTQEKRNTLDSKFIDEMFQLIGSPSRSDPGWDDIEHEFDANLEEDIRKIDEYLEAARVEEVEYQKYLLENTGFRDRLEKELTEPVLRELFNKNLQFFKDIWSGKGKSARHDQYARGGADRQELRFSMITDPYTELQLDWVLEEIAKVWMRDAEERRDNNDYVWKVLLPEVFIKLYMDHFSMERGEAEKRIRNTPLREEDDF